MINANELYRTGQLEGAIQALGVGLRDDPTDVQRRTFLFELLCFAGQYDRAEKQLDVLAAENRDAGMGALLYRSALHAERTRQQMFLSGQLPLESRPAGAVSGTWNGTPFSTLTDADPRLGARLEVYVAGQYTWIPLDQIESVRMEPPRRLRDLLWAPAVVRPGEAYQGQELGEVLVPALTPLAWQHPDGDIRLGRAYEWQELDDDRAVPVGLKVFELDGEVVPLLELRELVVTPAAPRP